VAPAISPPPEQITPPEEKFVIASGPLVVENQVDVAAQREGVIASLQAEPGARVHSGDILSQMDDRQVTADLEAAKAHTRSVAADLHNWEAEAKVLDADLQRAQKLWDAGLITKEQFDHTKYKAESDHWDVERVRETLTNAEASERSLSLELEKTRIRAPFDGVVARRYVRLGQKVALGDRLFWVSGEGPLRLRFTLPEIFLGHVALGQQLELFSPDVPDERKQARVIELSPVVDPSSGTIDVLCQIIGPPQGLRPGMQASVRVPKPQ
jgi:RND family efflux transporter MFP subunit